MRRFGHGTAVLLGLFGAPAMAQNGPGSGWTTEATVHGWLSAIDGSVGADG